MGSSSTIELTPSIRDGTVFCPIRSSYLDMDRCTGCRFLVHLRAETTDVTAEIVCSPTWAALVGGMWI
jgi:hypothetical protein